MSMVVLVRTVPVGSVGLVEAEGFEVEVIEGGESDAGYMIRDDEMLGELNAEVLAARMTAWRATLVRIWAGIQKASLSRSRSLRLLRSCMC